MPALQLPCCLERETSRSRRLLYVPVFSCPWEAGCYPRGPGGSVQAALPARSGSCRSSAGLAPVPASSTWEPLPERHLLSSFLSHSDFPPPLIKLRKEVISLFRVHAASGAWWLCPGAAGGMLVWWMRCHRPLSGPAMP